MKEITKAIENLYLNFGKYTTEGIEHCDCGCIKEEDAKKLNSKELRALVEDDLVAYHGSALYTWGDIEHYKHYLPRILELLSLNRNFSFVDLAEIFVKLDYAKWTEWDDSEIAAIKDYVLMDWVEFANNEKSEINERVLEAYGKFFDLKDIVKLWDISNSTLALRNFVIFFYYNGNRVLNGRLIKKVTKSENEFKLLQFSKKLIQSLESEFFKCELSDPEYAEKVSIVLQMIEQELKADRINGM